jgi:hypothetical protein
LSDKIIVPIPFRTGEQEVSGMQVVQRIAEIEAKKSRTDEAFEQFKSKLLKVKE